MFLIRTFNRFAFAFIYVTAKLTYTLSIFED